MKYRKLHPLTLICLILMAFGGCSPSLELTDASSASFCAALPVGGPIRLYTADSVFLADIHKIEERSCTNGDSLFWREESSYHKYKSRKLALDKIEGFSSDEDLRIVLKDETEYEAEAGSWYISNDNGRLGTVDAAVRTEGTKTGKSHS